VAALQFIRKPGTTVSVVLFDRQIAHLDDYEPDAYAPQQVDR